MRKILLLALLLVMGPVMTGSAGSAEELEYVGVYMRDQSGYARIVASGRVDRSRILVPAAIFPTDIAPGASAFDAKSGRLRLAVDKPQWKLETKALDARLSHGVTLNFLAVLHENDYFINIKNMEKILGIKLHHDKDAERLYIERAAGFADPQLTTARPAWSPVGKINLVWDYIPRFSPDLQKQPSISGLDVISPTWFALSADGRLLLNNADLKYVEDAHAKGYKVWPLFKNGDFDPDLTHRFLASETLQNLVINQLLVYTALYRLDGINVDFENVYEADRDRLTAFVKRLAGALREQNVISSVDVTVPGSSPNWSRCYDRKGLAQAVDYVMVMTYDEYWAASPVAGPVASLSWVDANLELLTREHIPREKLIMGIPFYAREWQEKPDASGRIKVRSRAYGMDAIQQKLVEHQLQPVWLDDLGLFYTEYEKDGSRYRIWLEEERSIARKAALVTKYDLAGAASWRKEFAAEHIWPVLEAELKPQTKPKKQ